MAKEKSKRSKRRAKRIPGGVPPPGRSANSAANRPFRVRVYVDGAELQQK